MPQQHVAISNHLRKSILSGELAAGTELPSEAELCQQFNTSRGPVRQAMANLRQEGLISSGRGRRSIVLEATMTESFESIVSATSFIASQGFTPGARTQWLARIPASEDVAAKLEITPGEPVVGVHRVRTANGQPMLIDHQYFRMEIGRHVLALDTDVDSIHRTLADQGITFDNVSRTLAVSMADEDDCRLLELTGNTPLLHMYMKCFDHSGIPVAYAEYRYNAAHVSLGMNITRGTPSPVWVSVEV